MSPYRSVLRNGCIGEAVRVLFKVIERLNKTEKEKSTKHRSDNVRQKNYIQTVRSIPGLRIQVTSPFPSDRDRRITLVQLYGIGMRTGFIFSREATSDRPGI